VHQLMARGGGSRGCVTFFSANSSRTGSAALSARVREAPSHTLALPWERFECLVVCWNFFPTRITRRYYLRALDESSA
jgi:hypothetical protein